MDPVSPWLDKGVMGAVIVALIATVVALWRRYNEVQDARVDDIQKHAETVVSLSNETNSALRHAVEAIRGRLDK